MIEGKNIRMILSFKNLSNWRTALLSAKSGRRAEVSVPI